VAAAEPSDVVVLVACDVMQRFSHILECAQARHGGKVLSIAAGTGSSALAIERLRSQGAIGPRTEVVVFCHGAMLEARHHLKLGEDIVPTMGFLAGLRAALKTPGQDAWPGRVHLFCCYGAQLREELIPGTSDWDAGQCIAYGSKGIIMESDVLCITDEVVNCLLERRSQGPVPIHEVVVRAASVAGGTVAALGGELEKPIWLPAREATRLLHEAYAQGEMRGTALQQEFDRDHPATPENNAVLARNFLELASKDPARTRADKKQFAYVLRELVRKNLDKVDRLISESPEILLKKVVHGLGIGDLVRAPALPAEWKAAQWQKAEAHLAGRMTQHCSTGNIDGLDECISLATRYRIFFTSRQIGDIARSCRADDVACERVFFLACTSESHLRHMRDAISEERFQDLGRRVLLYVCAEGSSDLVNNLLCAGVNGNVIDDGGDSLWHIALRRAAQDTASTSDWAALLEQLYAHAVVPNRMDHDGLLPLHLASKLGCLAAVRQLLSPPVVDGFVNATDRQGSTALHWAASEGHLDVAQWLVQNGADLRKKDRTGMTAFDRAFRHFRRLPQLKQLLS
jgi:hypothetical protein